MSRREMELAADVIATVALDKAQAKCREALVQAVEKVKATSGIGLGHAMGAADVLREYDRLMEGEE